MLLQQHLERLQPVHKALGIIEPVNAENDLLVGQHNLGRRLGHRDKAIEGYADGQRTNAHRATAMLDQQIFTVDPATKATLTAVHEVQTVVLDVEADHVATWKS